ncbi:hypothetical protein YC2023_089120 [Brassica napus]
MQPDIWEEWWRPACVLDMQPAMWSTRCRRACVRSHAERHTGCHQPEADWLVSPINTPRSQLISSHPDLEGSGQLKINQLKINSDGKQVNVVREREKESVAEFRRSILHQEAKLCAVQDQFSSMVSVQSRLWFDTLFKFQKNCSEAKEGAVQVEFSPDQYQGRFCTSQDQSSPVKSRRPLGFGHVLSDQPAASRLEHCELVCLNSTWNLGFPLSLKIVSQREAGLSGVECLVRIWNFSLRLGSRLSLCCVSGADSSDIKVVDIKAMRFPLLEARSWQEAKSNLVTVALGKDDRIASC